MDVIWNGLVQAFWLIVTGDPEVMRITALSLKVSGIATLCSLILGIPVGSFIGLARFPGRGFVLSLINTGMALPPVVVGLFVSIMLWRSGPLGMLQLLYSPTAIVIAQFILAFPVVTGLTVTAMQQIDPKLRLQLLGLGASRIQLVMQLLKEARLAMLAAIMAGFGAVISEIGASMMVGGNILHYSRVLTTATVLETARGNFELAIALSAILLVITFLINWALTAIQQYGSGR
ncbi:MAG TPA: ABC transporter permease [Candidatus Binatia bacterium]|jgi:tungstate transport system permease protein